ncbi:MAG: hypothetical protein ABMA02_06010 [Saprospiraceae bacterium]
MRFFIFMLVIISFFGPGCKHDSLFSGGTDPYPDPVDTLDPGIDSTGWPCGPDTAYFKNQVLPLLISQCAMAGCHDALTHEDGVILTDYQNVIATGKVKPSDPNGSDLYKSIIATSASKRMPRPPAAPLSAEQKELIRKWIAQGAKNNECNENYGACDTTGVTYSNFVGALMANQCTGCHGGAYTYGSLRLTTYAEVKASAQSGKLYGAIARQPGYVAMPQGGAALSSCFVSKVKSWVDAGMPQ